MHQYDIIKYGDGGGNDEPLQHGGLLAVVSCCFSNLPSRI